MGVREIDVNITKSVRSSAVLFHGVDVGPVIPHGKSFEWKAGKMNKGGVHMSLRILPGSDSSCL